MAGGNILDDGKSGLPQRSSLLKKKNDGNSSEETTPSQINAGGSKYQFPRSPTPPFKSAPEVKTGRGLSFSNIWRTIPVTVFCSTLVIMWPVNASSCLYYFDLLIPSCCRLQRRIHSARDASVLTRTILWTKKLERLDGLDMRGMTRRMRILELNQTISMNSIMTEGFWILG